MARRHRRKRTRVHDSQTIDAIHPQIIIHDASLLKRRHARGARRMVKRLQSLAHLLLEHRVRLRQEIVIEEGIIACGIDERVVRLRACDAQCDLEAPQKDVDIVPGF